MVQQDSAEKLAMQTQRCNANGNGKMFAT